jgi:hypothetical protein
MVPHESFQLFIRQNVAARSHALHLFRGQAGRAELRGPGLHRAHARRIVRVQIFPMSHVQLPAEMSRVLPFRAWVCHVSVSQPERSL